MFSNKMDYFLVLFGLIFTNLVTLYKKYVLQFLARYNTLVTKVSGYVHVLKDLK